MKSKLGRYLSPYAIRQDLREIFNRFPFTVGYLSLLSVWLIILIFRKSTIVESVTWPLCEGVLLSLTASLWCEYLGRKAKTLPFQLVVLGFVILDCLNLVYRGGVSGASEYIGRSAVVTALVIAILFLPSATGLKRRQLWYYSMRQFGAFAGGVALAGVLTVAVVVVFGTLDALFDVNPWKCMNSFVILLGLYVPSLFYLHCVPTRGEVVTVHEVKMLSFVGAFCKNILLPIVALYTLILYVYTAKILVVWTLPTDSISIMVTGLMGVSLIMLYGLQYYAFNSEANESARKITSFVRRQLPIVLLPLLVLMSVGVIYRVGEYGLTTSRLYVITYNIWAYGVVAYLIFKKLANLNIVAGTFAIVFLTVSIFPGLNLRAIATRSVRVEIIRTLTKAGVSSFPITEETLNEVLQQLPRTEAENLVSRLEYLDDWNDHKLVKDIVVSEERLDSWRLLPRLPQVVEEVELNSREWTETISVPSGFMSVKYYRTYNLPQMINADSIFSADKEVMKPLEISVDDSTKFVVTRIYRYGAKDERSYEVTGYEFKK